MKLTEREVSYQKQSKLPDEQGKCRMTEEFNPKEARALVERLRSWTTDWDGSKMVPGEPPRDGLHCDVIDAAADALTAALDDIERLRDALAWAVDSLEYQYPGSDPDYEIPKDVREALKGSNQ